VIDRYIIRRFLANFALLFALLFVFAISIDVILQLDRFVEVARRIVGEEAGALTTAVRTIGVILAFHGPRVFQFYAYLMGMVSIAAAAFTLAQMHRHRELVSLMASGVCLHRLAVPFLAAAFALNVVQLLNQELILPRLAPRLIRSHGDLERESVGAFAVPLTRHNEHHLIQSPRFNPVTATMERPTILERDADGRTTARVTADAMRFDDGAGFWRLENGWRTTRPGAAEVGSEATVRSPVDAYHTDLTPQIITMRRYGEFASMLSVRQLNRMMDAPGVVDLAALKRFKYSRFAAVLVNLLVLAISFRFFLLREPASLLGQSVWCAAMSVPAMIGALIGMTVALPGVPPAVGVFFPVLVLAVLALYFVPFIKT